MPGCPSPYCCPTARCCCTCKGMWTQGVKDHLCHTELGDHPENQGKVLHSLAPLSTSGSRRPRGYGELCMAIPAAGSGLKMRRYWYIPALPAQQVQARLSYSSAAGLVAGGV